MELGGPMGEGRAEVPFESGRLPTSSVTGPVSGCPRTWKAETWPIPAALLGRADVTGEGGGQDTEASAQAAE
ncbi:hypothetical protein J7E88_09245 [Streptomyces sp. ISL-10]|uniref:hypothetical protein n=1 Tax=Streptomyces sp. ISL-10 TaxID=2819172 RepID=UPI001BE675CD|nr:hypothetical protein [Streptomyces sp. ISL-10]MBT2365500.1 hypothetical protein [Streptomyces sp. ISL-10]